MFSSNFFLFKFFKKLNVYLRIKINEKTQRFDASMTSFSTEKIFSLENDVMEKSKRC